MTIGSPGSRAGCFCTCAGSLTAQGSAAPHVFGTSDIAFHFLLRCRHPGVRLFRGSMAGLYMPLSTLQGWPRGQPHMTQGRYGSLDLYRMTLSFTTTCRFSPALSGGSQDELPVPKSMVDALALSGGGRRALVCTGGYWQHFLNGCGR